MRLLVLFVGLFAAAAAIGAAPALPHSTLVVDTPRGPVRLTVELARDETSRMRGLMYRTHLDANAGMLFEFENDAFRTFWMKNTALPLDMVFIRADGTISSIAANATPMSEKVISSQEPVRAVLEINGGRAAALNIRPGEIVYNAVFANKSAAQ
jgi:uncharacterized membrane protein (UPF0127 family)